MMDAEPAKVRVLPPPQTPPAPSQGQALEAAFRQFAPYVARVCLRLTGRRDDVDDVVQDVFLAAHSRLGSLKNPEALKGWLATLTVRTVRRRLRRQRLISFFGLDALTGTAQPVDEAVSPAETVALKELYRVLSRLPVNDQLAWTLRHVEGESLQSVALLCGCSLATAKRRIQAAQTVVQEAFRDV